MNLADVMDELATALGSVTGLRAYAWPVGSIQAPAAVVNYPASYTYDETYGRGSDRMEVEVFVHEGKATDRTARDALAAYADGSGTRSVKAALESGTYTAFDSVRVGSVEFAVYELGAVPYATAIFHLDIFGQGAVS